MNYDCENDNMTREEMAMKIKSYQFAVTDISLYLNTHPDDDKALCLHKEYCKVLKDLRDKYQKVYGPLTIEYPINIKCPNPRLAKFIISQYGGPDGELAASLRYLSQRFGMPDQKSKAILNDIGTSYLK